MHGGTTLGVSISMVDLEQRCRRTRVDRRAAPAPRRDRRSARRRPPICTPASGQTVTLRHPLRVGTGFRFVDTALPVRAVHHEPVPLRRVHGPARREHHGTRRHRQHGQGATAAERLDAAAATVDRGDAGRRVRAAGELVVDRRCATCSRSSATSSSSCRSSSRRSRSSSRSTRATSAPRNVRASTRRCSRSGSVCAASRSCRSPRACCSALVGVGLGLGFGAALLRWILDTVFPAAVPDLAVMQAITTDARTC